jgi:hypothetical protein
MSWLQAELEANSDKMVLWVSSSPLGDGMLFEQLLNATLVFGQRCRDEMNESEPLSVINCMMHFARILLRKLGAEPIPTETVTEPVEVEGAQ